MKFLIIQTAFLGDAILATSVAEKLHQRYGQAQIDFVLRKGNEGILAGHPFVGETLVLDKTKHKLRNLLAVSKTVRRKKYDCVINLHRFGSSGFLAWRSGAKEKIGFDKNPFSFSYTRKVHHQIGNGKHEIERNHELIAHLTGPAPAKPRLYPSPGDAETVARLLSESSPGVRSPYACIAPASIWFTKQFPGEKWMELIQKIPYPVLLVGSSADARLCESIREKSGTASAVINLAGRLSLLQTAALMKNARMNYANDSAALHIASAMNAPVTAVFCSTVPAFGFGPLSDESRIIQTAEKLECRPCGLHGHRACPAGHFRCAWSIQIKDMLP